MNSALQLLASKLHSSVDIAKRLATDGSSLDKHLKALQEHVKAGSSPNEPEDLQVQAVRHFWDKRSFETLKEARLVSFGLCLPSRPGGPCVLEDRERFNAVLSSDTGVEQWVKEPRWFRHCYQGLVRSYFSYDDTKGSIAPDEGRRNWRVLREYLHDRAPKIVDADGYNPDWVITTTENTNLFSIDPCAPYAEAALAGDTADIERMRELLGISDDSWFISALVRSQIAHATSLPYEEFKDLIPNLLSMLANLARHGIKIRNYGLSLILNTYTNTSSPTIHTGLRDAAVEWWGNPWLPSTAAQWGGVTPSAREMVAEWLRGEFIEAFFTKFSEDGIGDRRRANFWLRYVKSMTDVQFALGSRVLNSPSHDFAVLLQKMTGLHTELKGTSSTNNAFIMTLGDLVAVEFSDMGNALYGYQRDNLPFVFDSTEPLGLSSRGPNPLKSKELSRLWLLHKDDINGYRRWENMFEAALIDKFNIAPETPSSRPKRSAAQKASESTALFNAKYGKYDPYRLRGLGKTMGFKVDDLRKKGGNLWAYTDSNDPELIQLFQDWGFQYRAGKGWWKK
ncbi:EH signature domain-containing protein [Castellaniella sp.]|uniref:EH signature domain-containing protein n=1 Tax=Castellaniella sp. TaxID=1955812 RepID=UPI002AFFE6D4|nr:EH signature domain-containing protein [Castellaniella sp.]